MMDHAPKDPPRRASATESYDARLCCELDKSSWRRSHFHTEAALPLPLYSLSVLRLDNIALPRQSPCRHVFFLLPIMLGFVILLLTLPFVVVFLIKWSLRPLSLHLITGFFDLLSSHGSNFWPSSDLQLCSLLIPPPRHLCCCHINII